jgi:type IV pilus assembly protein PilE
MSTKTVSRFESTIRPSRGFTLTEVMIVVVIIGVLAAIAWPSYQAQVRESKRSDAHNALTTIAAQQERFFSDNNAYTADLQNLGYNSATNVPTPEGYYVVTASNVTAVGYLLTAVPCTGSGTPTAGCNSGSQVKDTACSQITLSSTGVKGGTTSACW